MDLQNGEYIRGERGEKRGTSAEFYENPVTGKTHLRLRFAGDKLFMPDFEVEEHHKLEYPREWEAFQKGGDQLAGQTRLEHVPWMDEGLRRVFAYHNVQTVEQLAAMTDTGIGSVGPGALKLREKAREHVEAAEKASQFDAMAERMAEMQAEIEALKSSPKAARAADAARA